MHQTFFKSDKLAEKKADFQSRKRHSKQYSANRMLCLKLDNWTCRNPECPDIGDTQDMDFRIKDAHHIRGKDFGSVNDLICLCRYDHRILDKNRRLMFQVLKKLKETLTPDEFRWNESYQEFEKKYK